jgi:hypothetical protein
VVRRLEEAVVVVLLLFVVVFIIGVVDRHESRCGRRSVYHAETVWLLPCSSSGYQRAWTVPVDNQFPQAGIVPFLNFLWPLPSL